MTELQINTTQNVNINFTAASVGERILAYAVDLIIKIAYSVVVFQLLFNLFSVERFMMGWDDWSRIAFILIFFLPVIFYTLVFESLLEGQTLGKRLLKIKVVKIDGYQASFADYIMRWFFRIIDINMMGGIIGLVTVIVNDRNQRLGDISAGTAVISLKDKITINHTILEKLSDKYVPTYPSVINLSDNDVRIIKETLLTAKKSLDHVTLMKLKSKVEEVIGVKAEGYDTQVFIDTVLKDYNYYTQSM
ncbi:RDD family protein [Zhouia amylolytica]|uniref:Putative membrane protein n=1 Tax=Zhouia amylolytica AD3 TaxID=1286632 RepID=W2URF1_9FLAO|nr:RDD family protein [Zhouia amylolytica]ETN96524.1 putative membrane protein [Zhouia amylolytica AD3]MCQ0109988.1 RDD family protein [Zhouia amylolytica]